jgi:hypothetical protein
MSQPDRNTTKAKRSVSASLLLGLLLVPLSAYAASVLVGDRVEPVAEAPAPPPVATPVTVTEFAPQTATAADLEAACGDLGRGMVAAEAEGSITDVQQAALDALREICAQQGMPLPGKPAPPPVTQTVVLADSQPTTTVGGSPEIELDDDQESDDDQWEDDDHEEDDDHDDDHDEEAEDDD